MTIQGCRKGCVGVPPGAVARATATRAMGTAAAAIACPATGEDKTRWPAATRRSRRLALVGTGEGGDPDSGGASDATGGADARLATGISGTIAATGARASSGGG